MYKIFPRSSGVIFVSLERKTVFVFKSEQLTRDLDRPEFNFNKEIIKISDNNCRWRMLKTQRKRHYNQKYDEYNQKYTGILHTDKGILLLSFFISNNPWERGWTWHSSISTVAFSSKKLWHYTIAFCFSSVIYSLKVVW